MSGVRSETLEMVAEWRRREAEYFAVPEPATDDFLDRWLPAAESHLDAGWNGYGLSPSQTLSMRYCTMMTPDPAERAVAQRFAEWVKLEARLRFEQGYHPFPLTDLRPAVAATGQPFPSETA